MLDEDEDCLEVCTLKIWIEKLVEKSSRMIHSAYISAKVGLLTIIALIFYKMYG